MLSEGAQLGFVSDATKCDFEASGANNDAASGFWVLASVSPAVRRENNPGLVRVRKREGTRISGKRQKWISR